MTRGDRPELTAPPEYYYNDNEAEKYTHNTRIMTVQAKLTARAVELLQLDANDGGGGGGSGSGGGGGRKLVLDVGCGSCLSAAVLREAGYEWVGIDIAPAMLDVAQERMKEGELEGGDVILGDMGQGLPFRPGIFDGCVSISAVQWLCNADKSGAQPHRRLNRFFSMLYHLLVRGGRAVLQFYPDGAKQAEMITRAAMKAGFGGGMVVDFPNSTRAKKYFLVLTAGVSGTAANANRGSRANAAEGPKNEVAVGKRERIPKKRGAAREVNKTGGREWVLKKKEVRRKRGYADVPVDTKYTARKRSKPSF